MSTIDWTAVPCVGFDLETTGVDVFEDRIVQAAVVTVIPGYKPQVHTWLVNPGVEIPDGAAEVHGITTERAQAEGIEPGRMLFEVAGMLARAMGKRFPVVAFNAAFDLTMFEAECRRHGEPTLASRVAPLPIGPIVDPFVLDKRVDPYRKGGRKLSDMAAHYGVELTQAHDAGADALAACQIWPEIIARYPDEFDGLTVGGLHMAQIGWRRAQMDSLRKYFDRKGQEHDGCDGSWPVRPRQIANAETQGSLL